MKKLRVAAAAVALSALALAVPAAPARASYVNDVGEYNGGGGIYMCVPWYENGHWLWVCG